MEMWRVDRPVPWHAGQWNGIPAEPPEPTEEEQEMNEWFMVLFADEQNKEVVDGEL